MHQGTPASNSIRGVALVVSLMALLFCIQGIFTEYELFVISVGGFDAFFVLYGVGMVVSVLTMYGIVSKNKNLEFWGMVFMTWLFALIGMFTLIISYLQSPFIVVCLGIAMISGIIAAYMKDGNREKSISGVTKRAD